MLDLEPEGRDVRARRPWAPDHVPTEAELLGVRDAIARDPARAARRARSRRTGSMALEPHVARTAPPDIAPPPAPFTAPRTSCNRALTPHRSFAMTTLSLDDVKVVKNEFGATRQRRRAGDVRGLRCARYLDGRGERAAQDLVAMVPMSVRGDDQKRHRRQPGLVDARFAGDDDRRPGRATARDPAGMRSAKDQQNAIGADDAAGLGRVRGTGSRGSRRPALRRHEAGRPAPPDLQRHHLERARAAVPAVLRGRADGARTTRWGRSSTAPDSTSP